MSTIDGSYDCAVKSPIGEQKSVLTIVSDGDRFTGTNSGAMGVMEIAGTIDGDTLTWKQTVTAPMKMTLDCVATIAGDTLTGSVSAGFMGRFAMTGTRAA